MKNLIFLIFTFAFSLSTLAEDLDRSIDSAVFTHALATSYEDWKTSGNSPEEIFRRARLSSNLDQLCNKIATANSREILLLFATEILIESENSGCFKGLAQKVNYEFGYALALQVPMVTFGVPDKISDIKTHIKVIDPVLEPALATADLPSRQIAFTFDDGPHPVLTKKLLDILDNFDLKATFFVVGRNAKSNPSFLHDILARGHTLGTHSWSHKQLSKISHQSAVREIEEGFNATFSETGIVAPFFRFPYGARTNKLKKYLADAKISRFFWNIDTLDWKITDPGELYKFALGEISKANRGIVLFHDVQAQTIAMMPYLLEELYRRQYQPVLFKPNKYFGPDRTFPWNSN